jgi:hypothetical protein
MTDWFINTFLEAAGIVRCYRDWFKREADTYPLHPAVAHMMQHAGYRPRDWQQLLLEWPHRSVSDPSRVAYTRDERSGEADRQTLTTLGKYLTRHFDVPDHVIRDVVALMGTGADSFKILDTVDAFVHAINHGPHSCMCWHGRDGVMCEDGVRRHPYAVYDPQYGWRMAVRYSSDGAIVGRALLNANDDGRGYWVRSYKREPSSSYSTTDEALEAWLRERDYYKASGWAEDTEIALYRVKGCDDEILLPYIDGDTQRVDINGRSGGAYITDNGEYTATNTDGTSAMEGRCACPDCGDRGNEDDMYSTGFYGDHMVCRYCYENEYTVVSGRRGEEYAVPNDDAVEVDGQWYHNEYLSDNDIVELASGDYAHEDNAVLCTDDDEWYLLDDSDLIYCEYDSQYHLVDNCVETEDEGWVHKDDAWQCEGSDLYYSDNTDYVEIDDCKYHPDHTPETTDKD